jgi:hypothetical protein
VPAVVSRQGQFVAIIYPRALPHRLITVLAAVPKRVSDWRSRVAGLSYQGRMPWAYQGEILLGCNYSMSSAHVFGAATLNRASVVSRAFWPSRCRARRGKSACAGRKGAPGLPGRVAVFGIAE